MVAVTRTSFSCGVTDCDPNYLRLWGNGTLNFCFAPFLFKKKQTLNMIIINGLSSLMLLKNMRLSCTSQKNERQQS